MREKRGKMNLYYELVKMLFRKCLLRQSTGMVVRKFSERMGLAYIKFAQILAMQNFGKLFTEDDRRELMGICDSCNPISYEEIEKILKEEYGDRLWEIFRKIDVEPVGSASISQVHRAVLSTGEVVAVKVKRRDITRTVDKDIVRIKKLVGRYGRFIGFKNLMASDRALGLYLGWVQQEIDFKHEQENIRKYQKFADMVNGKVPGAGKIELPKLYEELSTENVIVMEFIDSPTINQLELTTENKRKVVRAVNDYMRVSFWALFHDEPVVFHGDLHGGNIYIKPDGTTGFLDMGLIFVLSTKEQELLKEFFLAAYARRSERIYELLVPYGEMDEDQRKAFWKDIEKYCDEVKTKNITAYFVDMVLVCIKYQFLPPDFLFQMVKTFACLSGIGVFTENFVTAPELLKEQVAEFLVRRGMEDCFCTIKCGVEVLGKMVDDGIKHGLTSGIVKGMMGLESLNGQIKQLTEHFDEALGLLRA